MTITSPNPHTISRANSSTPLIRLEEVTKVFLTDEVETHALSGIDLDIRNGQYVSIAGPSGCGKSTLLSILGLLDTPSNGRYSLKGKEVANLSFAERARIRNREIGFIFQSFNLIGDLTVYENVELPLTYRGMSAGDRKAFVTEALDASAWRIGRSICRVSFRVANSSALRLRALSQANQRSCLRTSRREISIQKMAKESWTS